MNETRIDITHIPFSRYGAYVSVSRDEGKKELIIHNVKRRFEEGPMFSLTFGKDELQDFVCMASPEKIRVENENGHAQIYIRDDQTVGIESFGLDLQVSLLRSNGYGVEESDRTFRMISVEQRTYTTFAVEQGAAYLEGPFEAYSTCENLKNKKKQLHVSCENGHILMALTLSFVEPKPVILPICPKEEMEEVKAEWNEFLGYLSENEEADEETGEFARITWYNLWSSFVHAEDVYQHDTMLMSKKYMSSVWSWDHCFNALAMAKISKQKAMEQFEAPFVLQSEHGVLPDMWNPHSEIVWGVTKPPIHGWCFSRLMDQYDFDAAELRKVFGYLKKLTGWWMEYSDTDHDGIPEYPQGCDSGWDNATLFDCGFFVETPDLPAFLILQMQTLSRIAKELEKKEDTSCCWTKEAEHWEKEANELLERFYEHSWNGERFVAKMSGSHACDGNSTCLLALMPLVLGELLDKEKREKLKTILEKDFLTANGLATEMPSSKEYESDGYWRGPIWAPTTYLLIDGLRRGGYASLAEQIAAKYCHMSCKIAKGNYENFDALTGEGLRAPGYTWAASVYMLLHWEYGK